MKYSTLFLIFKKDIYCLNKKRFLKIKEVLKKRQTDLTVFMDNVHKPHNLAAIARSCDAAGILDIHTWVKSEQIDISRKISGGTAKWTRIVDHQSSVKGVDYLHQKGFKVLAAHFSDKAIDFRDIDYTEKIAVVFGAELDGISEDIVDKCDQLIYIPMHGMVQSLNVSVACAVILFEAKSQRDNAGYYDQMRMDEDLYQKILFEWCYPEIAEVCRKKEIPYPAIDLETGEILEGFFIN